MTTENVQKCTSESFGLKTTQTRGSSLSSWPDSWLHPGTDEEMSTNCQPHSPVHDDEVLAVTAVMMPWRYRTAFFSRFRVPVNNVTEMRDV